MNNEQAPEEEATTEMEAQEGLSMRQKLKKKTERWIRYFTTVVTKTPWLVLWSTLFAFFVCMALLIAVEFQMTKSSEWEWVLPDDKFTERQDMIYDARDNVDDALVPERSDPTYDFYFFYDADPRNFANKCDGPLGVFSPRNVREACLTEKQMWGRRKYDKFCYLPGGLDECPVPGDSMVTLAYGDQFGEPLTNSSFIDCPLLDEATLQMRWDSILAILRNNPRDSSLSFYFDEAAPERGYPCKGRSLISLGTPLRGESDISEWDDDQYRKIDNQLVSKTDTDLVDHFNMKDKPPLQSVYMDRARAGASGKKMDVLWTSAMTEETQFVDAVNSDFMWAIASVVFVWIWICVHTGSVTIGTVSMLQIIFSLPLALFFYRVVLQIRYIQIMQQLVIFVMLGIGADDVFVYTDAWNQSKDLIPVSPLDDADSIVQKRVAFAYRRAFTAIFNTSFTTAAAFLSTAISGLIPISTFGIFAALCVIMNFALVLTVTPAIVVIHHRRQCGLPRSNRRQKENDDEKNVEMTPVSEKPDEENTEEDAKEEEDDDVAIEVEKNDDESCCKQKDKPWSGADRWVQVYLSVLTFDGGLKKLETEAKVGETTLERTRKKYKPVAWLFVAILAGYAGAMCGLASRLTTPSQPEVWFPSAHMATRTDKLFYGAYGANDASYYPVISVVWGMDRLARGDFDPFVPHENRGDVRYTNLPRLYQTSAQQQVLRACEGLRTFNCESGCAGELLTRPNSTVCFLEEFQQWHAEQFDGNSTYGLDMATFNARLINFRDTTTPKDDSTATSWKELIGVVDGKFRFFRLDARLSMDIDESLTQKAQVLRRANKFMSRYARDLNTDLPSVWHTSDAWLWFKAQRELIRGLLTGMAIAFPIAFVVLTGATGNVVLAFLAMITIGAIVASVLGLAYLLGWDLGIKESVAGVVVIGLAVDYTLHLGHMYDHDRKNIYREDKIIHAVLAMGPTVFNGAITTAGSAVFLLLAQFTSVPKSSFQFFKTIINFLSTFFFFLINSPGTHYEPH